MDELRDALEKLPKDIEAGTVKMTAKFGNDNAGGSTFDPGSLATTFAQMNDKLSKIDHDGDKVGIVAVTAGSKKDDSPIVTKVTAEALNASADNKK